MTRVLSITLIIVLVLAALAYFTGPLWTFYDLRASAESEDVQSLSKIVDFDSVRAGLKTQLEAGPEGVAAPPPSPMTDPAGAAGDLIKKGAEAVGNAFNDLINPKPKAEVKAPPPDPNTFLTPRALLALSYGAGRNAPRTDPKAYANKPVPKVTFWSLERVRLSVKDKGEGKTIFTLERKGVFRWQITHIGLPEVAKGPPPPLTENPKSGAAASTSVKPATTPAAPAPKPAAPAAKPVSASALASTSSSASAPAKPSPVE